MTESHLPHNLEAEAALLGACLLDETALFSVLDQIKSDDFYGEAHRLIYEAVVALVNESAGVDLVTVRAKLDALDLLKKVGGVSALTALVDALPDVQNAVHYSRVVKDAATRRRLITFGRDIASKAVQMETAKHALDEAMFQLTKLAESSSSGEIMHVADYGKLVVEELESLVNGSISSVGVRTGLHDLDSKVLMRNGRVCVVAGATSSGKSSLALQIADQVATAGQKVAFFSLEMSGEELATRILSAHTGHDQRVIEGGPATPKTIEDLNVYLKTMRGAELYVDDNPAATPLDIRARARQIQMRHGLDLVIVDYLQLVSPGARERGRSREQEVAAMSRQLKVASRALGVPFIVLSQLSRRHLDEGRKPELRDLRESGAIENDADIVVMVYRPDLEQTDGLLLVRKQRQGPLGQIDVSFNPKTTRFSESGISDANRYYDEGAPDIDEPVAEVEEGDIDF